MNARRAERWMWLVAGVLLSTAAVRWRAATRTLVQVEGPIAEGTDTLTEVDAARIAEEVERTVSNDVFRASRRPSPTVFTPTVNELAPTVAVRPPRPALAVTGIIGPPWAAVLEGVPGREGSLIVYAGDSLGALKVRQVRRDSVVIHGPDTTWRLGVRRAW